LGFHKTSRTEILAFRDNSESSFNKSASFSKTASHFQNEGIKIDVQASLDTVADTYKISKNPDDYVYVISRALTADVPNENHDNFPSEELLRFDAGNGCRVFQTFINKPNHINHRADDPTQARGVILDAHYNDINPDDQFVEILVAVDKTKDTRLAESIQKNEVNSMSMGCYAELCICSVCGHEADSTDNLCPDHIRGGKKGKEFNGVKSFENCHKVSFNEESWVDEPADPQALVSEVMKIRASIEAVTDAKNVGYESEIFILNTKLANIEKMIHSITAKTASKKVADGMGGVQEAAAEMADEVQKIQDYLGKLAVDVESGAISYEEYLEKVNNLSKSIELDTDEIEESLDDNNKSEENNEENKMASKNPYAKLAEIKKESKGGCNPKDYTGIDSGKGNPPKEWANPGKGDGASPAEWKFASTSKVALDEKAKKYWSDYYQAYGQALIKDLKRKKIGSTESISFDQMRLLDPKMASVMKELEIGSLKVSTIFKLAEEVGLTIEADEKETSELLTRSIDDTTEKKWNAIDASLKTSDVTLDLIGNEWHIRDAGKSIMVFANVDELDAKEFKSDDFASGIIASLKDSGAAKTAETYKVALYDTTLDPSFVDESNDDMRGDVKKKPSNGVEGEGIDDLDGINKSEIKDKDGVAESVELDMKTSSIEKEAIGTDYSALLLQGIVNSVSKEESPGARKIVERVTADPSFKERITRLVKAIEEDAKVQLKSEEITPQHMQSSKIAEDLSNFIIASYKEALDKTAEEEEVVALVIENLAEYEYDTPSPAEIKAEEDEDEGVDGPQMAEMAPEATDTEEEDKEAAIDPEAVADDTKEAGVLDDAENDLDGEGMTEQTKGITSDGTGDLDGVNKESYPDKVYDEGQDDLAGEKGTVVKVSAKEVEELKQAHSARFNRSLKLAIKRSNLNLISNELKAALHDALTSECDLPEGDVYTAMDDSLSKYLIESAFEVGAGTYFDDMLKESNKLMSLPEDALLAIEADINDLQAVDPSVAAPRYEEFEEEVTNATAKAQEAAASNPVFKSSAAEAEATSGRHAGLKGAFGTAVVTDAMKNRKG